MLLATGLHILELTASDLKIKNEKKKMLLTAVSSTVPLHQTSMVSFSGMNKNKKCGGDC